MRLRKKQGGCSIAGVEWPEDGAVAEVPDELGTELLALAPEEYKHMLDDTDPGAEPEPEPDVVQPANEPAVAEVPDEESVPEQPAPGNRGQQSRNRRR